MTSTTEGDTMEVALDSLVMDPDLQIRGGTDLGTVSRYAKALKAGETFPPITVIAVDPDDHSRGFILIDGWHRVEAVRANEREPIGGGSGGSKIVAKVLAGEDDRKRWQWLAARANQRHGLPLPYKRRREVFRAYVKAGEHRESRERGSPIKSARAMTRDLAGTVSHPTLLKWMQSDFPSVYRAMNERAEGDFAEEAPVRETPDQCRLRVIAGSIEQMTAAFRAIDAQEVRDQVTKRVDKLLKELRKEPLRDYSNTEAVWARTDEEDEDW